MENPIMKIREPQPGNMRDFLTIFFKHKTMIMVIFFSVVLTVAIGSLLSSRVYEAKSTLLIKIGREYLYHPEVGSNQPAMSLNQEEVLNSEIQILTSRDLIKKVIETLKVEKIYPDLTKDPQGKITPIDLAIQIFSKKLKVEGIKKSSVIEVSFQHGDPQIAAKAVNLLVDLFREKHLQVFSTPQSSFLEGQVTNLRQKLSETDNKMQSFKQKNRVYSLDEQRTLLLRQRTDLNTDLMNTRNRVSELRKRVASLKAQSSRLEQNQNLYTPTERDKILVEGKTRLLALQINEQELLRKYTDKNKMVVDTRKEIQMVKDFLKEQEKDIHKKVLTGNAIYQEAQKGLVTSEADLSAQIAKQATLSGQLGKLDEEIRDLDLREKDMLNLKRELTVNEKNLQTYGEKMEEARISDDMNRLKLANISVIEAATVPTRPVKPKTQLNVALGIIVGALSSIGLAFLSERSTQAFTDPESVERKLNLAVIACIPYKE